MSWLWLLLACGTATPTPTEQDPAEESEATWDTDTYLSSCAAALCTLEEAGCDTDLGCGDEAACQAALAEDPCFTWQSELATSCLEAMDQAATSGSCMSIADWLSACGDVFTYTGDCR